LLTYIIVGLIWLTLVYSSWWIKHMTPILERALFSVDHLHVSLKRAAAINTLSADDIARIRNINSLL